ncbi:unnamed protein product [Eretmochelys imbricata]
MRQDRLTPPHSGQRSQHSPISEPAARTEQEQRFHQGDGAVRRPVNPVPGALRHRGLHMATGKWMRTNIFLLESQWGQTPSWGHSAVAPVGSVGPDPQLGSLGHSSSGVNGARSPAGVTRP